jgi:hypothetical protein
MTFSRFSSAAALLLSLSLAGASAVSAQDAPGRGTNPQQAQQRVVEMFLDHATAELNLTAEQRSGLEVALQETMDRRGELARNQQQLRREIRDALSDPETADDEFRRLADASLMLKRQEVELLGWQQDRLLEELTPRQSLRFMLLQEQLAQRIQAMRRERGR